MMTFDEYEVAIKSECTLQGTITRPKAEGKYAAVIIIADLEKLTVMEQSYR